MHDKIFTSKAQNMARRVSEVNISGLLGSFDYSVKFPSGSDNVIIIAPNGYGKTAFLAALNTCLQLKLAQASKQTFSELEVIFDDKTRWNFQKTREAQEVDGRERRIRNGRAYVRRTRPREWVKFTAYDQRGTKLGASLPEAALSLPPDLLYRALDRNLPIMRETYDTFRDMNTDEVSSASEIFERYREQLLHDDEFRQMLGPHFNSLLQPDGLRVNCVFIETQRLLLAKRSVGRDESEHATHEEEISRQSQQLSLLLQSTYSNYASISQGLDRSFPSRLITRAATPGPRDALNLRSDLDAIENRRKSLTEAGILVESSEPLIAPKDEFLSNVADALAIYVEDSQAKLSTFDDIHAKVSVFRDLLNKKLHPKELIITRQAGALIRRGDKNINLEGLSSGEKHEFIMLFRLIFETPNRSLVLIDEPEISLHVLWQLEFMSDLRNIQGANPFQAIIATHSPQIFQGMDDLIVDLADQAA